MAVSKYTAIAVLCTACIASAVVGASATLIFAKSGPEGTRGPAGPVGIRGPRGYAAYDEAGENAEAEVEELRGEMQQLEYLIDELGGQVTEVTQTTSNLCIELDAC